MLLGIRFRPSSAGGIGSPRYKRLYYIVKFIMFVYLFHVLLDIICLYVAVPYFVVLLFGVLLVPSSSSSVFFRNLSKRRVARSCVS